MFYGNYITFDHDFNDETFQYPKLFTVSPFVFVLVVFDQDTKNVQHLYIFFSIRDQRFTAGFAVL